MFVSVMMGKSFERDRIIWRRGVVVSALASINVVNPHQYTLRSLLIRTPGVHVDPSGISSFITHVHDDVVSEMIF